MKKEIIERVKKEKIVAIIRGINPVDCLKLAQILYKNGISVMEIPFDVSKTNNDNTIISIMEIKKTMPDVIVGAGTVINIDFFNKAKEAGAQFIVSPNIDNFVITEAKNNGIVVMPGAMTPTEIEYAHRLGADFVKVFPASVLGAGYIKAVRSPLNNIDIIAVGGVNENNAGDFIKAGAIGVGVGCVANKALIKEHKWQEIEDIIIKLKKSVNEARM
ncbi:MAG: bifunctional 4-hydroxy-2-oxoglutarate aldolase/2-dehydro-3-deoxy-phosphogluconate aldolase [Clostridia bacterium]|nr:bifunctional 4-hydroxy-2-oxoglutarate aldolase/2-dehydro-3-deoxy-phosphogluconate aldolase [Clostridia bacterium]